MARICELTGKRPMKGSIIWRSGKSKKSGGIGTHVTAIHQSGVSFPTFSG